MVVQKEALRWDLSQGKKPRHLATGIEFTGVSRANSYSKGSAFQENILPSKPCTFKATTKA